MSESRLFARLLAGFLLGVTGVHASCPIELNPPSVVVKYGDSVSINCSSSVAGRMGWEATLGGTGIKKAQHLTWSVENLTDWTVSLQCFFNPFPNTPYKMCFETPKLVLYTFPETIVIRSSSGSDGVMEEMKEYTFTCDVYNVAPVQNLSVLWFKDDTLVFTDTFKNPDRKPVNQSSVFTYTPKRNDSGVTFRCEAHLDLGPEGPQYNISSEEYNITVHFGPELQCSAPELPEGETLEKHCPVTGNPTPSVRWLKDGQPTDPAMPLRRENAGLYTVEAEGSSSMKKDLQVLVLYGPELECPSNYTALEYAPHSFICKVKGYPQPEITWYKDNEEVEPLENLTRRDAGQYMITASNRLSTVNVSVEITVTYPPSQIAELEDSEVEVGSTVWLKCSTMGNPRPKYSWNYYRTANVVEENDDGVSRLHIHNATAYNMGSYTCHASNDEGNVSKTVRVTVKGAKQECPVEISPSSMVIQYGDQKQEATCKASSEALKNQEGKIYWQVQGRNRTVGRDKTVASWSIDTHKDWDPRPHCTATFRGIGTCQKSLNFILYKMPDSVSIRSEDDISPLMEEKELQLQCDITNVAPARNLVVLWYQGDKKLEPRPTGPLRVTGCLSEKREDCAISVVRSPVNVTSSVNITVNRTHNGAEFTCKALLDLEPTGPKLLANMTSDPLNITVFYKPFINTTKLPKTVPVFRGYPTELVCEADGNPPPKIQWIYNPDKVPHLEGNTLTVSEEGFYNCSAANKVGYVTHQVQVILKEDYLPLIAGFVAVTVVAISVIFLFIYSIYYKNTKMRRYSLKNPKLSTHNGNVAHNGWDQQFPMTKLS